MISPLLLAAAASLAQVNVSAASAMAIAAQGELDTIEAPLTLTVELFADPKGKVIECVVRGSGASARAEKSICRAALKQKIEAARNSQGLASYGSTHFSVRNGAGRGADLPEMVMPADLVLRIGEYPAGVDHPLRLDFLVEVASDGRIHGCMARDAGQAELASMACKEVAEFPMMVRRGKDGSAVPYVAPFGVDFATPAPPA